MSAEVILLRVDVALSIALLVLGAIVALASANVVKRVSGVLIAHIGAILGAAALVDGPLLIVGVGMMGASLVIGCALIVRLQERYGGVEALDHDIADADSEPREAEMP